MPKTKKPKTARAVLTAFQRACEHGSPSFAAIIEAIEFLLRREAEKEREERLHARILEDAGSVVGDPYSGSD